MVLFLQSAKIYTCNVAFGVIDTLKSNPAKITDIYGT